MFTGEEEWELCSAATALSWDALSKADPRSSGVPGSFHSRFHGKGREGVFVSCCFNDAFGLYVLSLCPRRFGSCRAGKIHLEICLKTTGVCPKPVCVVPGRIKTRSNPGVRWVSAGAAPAAGVGLEQILSAW